MKTQAQSLSIQQAPVPMIVYHKQETQICSPLDNQVTNRGIAFSDSPQNRKRKRTHSPPPQTDDSTLSRTGRGIPMSACNGSNGSGPVHVPVDTIATAERFVTIRPQAVRSI